MKIAYISSSAYSDVDLSYIGEAQKSLDITYFVLMNSGNRRTCALDLRDDSLLHGINKGYNLKGVGKYSDISNIKTAYVLYNEGKHAYDMKSLSFWCKVYRYLKQEGFDVIHFTTAPSIFNPFAFLLRDKLVLTVHDPLPHSSATSKSTELYRKIAFKWIKNFILLNKAQISEFKKTYGIKNINIQISSLGAYTYLLKYNDNIHLPKPYVLFFGNIHSYKGLDYLFPAMELAHTKYPELTLVVAGKGKYYFDIEKYLKLPYFKIDNRFIPDGELAAMIRECEFVVVPYVDATQSGVIMSAYAYCKPCIATNVGGLPEMVNHEHNGLIVEPKDVEGLAAAIIDMHQGVEKLNSFMNAIKLEYYHGKKSWKNIVDEMTSIYRTINLKD